MKLSIRHLLAMGTLAVFLLSCQKEVGFQDQQTPGGGPADKSILGDYVFVDLSASTKSTVTVTDLGMQMKSVTTSDYITRNNTGTVKITSNQMLFNKIGYSIDTTMHVLTYLGG